MKKKPANKGRDLLTCLKLISMLSTKRMTIKEIAGRVNKSERTIYRYLALFENVGFCMDKDFTGKYFIFASPAL